MDGERRSGLAGFYEDPWVTVSSGVGRAERQLDLLRDTLDGSRGPIRILDVGCGDGMATAMAAQVAGFGNVVGLDWAERPLKQAQERGLTTARASLDGDGLPIASQEVDVVIMSEVIEHLVTTDEAITEVRRVLKPRGVLLLSTPNLAAWFNRLLLLVGVQPAFSEVSLRSIYGRPGSEVVGHLHLFTRRALSEFLADNGFTVLDMKGAPYHDVPRVLRPVDMLMCHWPSAASILIVRAKKT